MKPPNFILVPNHHIPDRNSAPTHAQVMEKETVIPVSSQGQAESNMGRSTGNSFADIFGARSSAMDRL